jgi:hypothetical protein
LRHRHRAKPTGAVKIASASDHLAAGQRTKITLRLHLTAASRHSLRPGHHLGARLVIITTPAATMPPAAESVTLARATHTRRRSKR